MEKVKAFLEHLRSNPEFEAHLKGREKCRTLDEEAKVYAEVASALGFDLTEQDFKSYAGKAAESRRQKTEAAAEKIRELPEEALDMVAGGKDHAECKDTYKDRENCWSNDGCDNIVYWYNDYICHWYYSLQCEVSKNV